MASPDPVLEQHLRRQLVRYAVQRKITCPVTGVVLDMRSAVVIDDADDHFVGVVSPAGWELVKDRVLAELPGALITTWDEAQHPAVVVDTTEEG